MSFFISLRIDKTVCFLYTQSMFKSKKLKKISVEGNIQDKERIFTLCPYCGYESEAVLFETETELCLYYIPIKKINNRFTAVCLKCKHSFDVEIS